MLACLLLLHCSLDVLVMQSSFVLLQGLQSPAPDIAHFSQQALLAVEGIMHPRAGHTILQPQRHSANPHPYLSASTAELAELGMPRLWSPLAPHACKPAQTATGTAADALRQQQATAASLAMAQEVLQAGRVCSAAVAKLQASLAGSDVANRGQPAVHAPEQPLEQQMADYVNGGHDTAPAAAAALTEAALAAAAPLASLHALGGSVGAPAPSLEALATLISNGGQNTSVPAHAAYKSSAGIHAHGGIGTSPGVQPGPPQGNEGGGMLATGADDGYISLEHQSATMDRSDTGKEPTADTQMPQMVEGYMAAAESSDSQGSLPDIDSGESSDNSSSQ